MPIRSKFQSGLMMDWRASLVLAFPTGGDGGRETNGVSQEENKGVGVTARFTAESLWSLPQVQGTHLANSIKQDSGILRYNQINFHLIGD